MTEPKREQLLEALVTLLKTISPTNGYWTAPVTVSRQRQDIPTMDATHLPALFPTDGNETINPAYIGAASKSVQNNFTCSIVGGVEDPTKTSTMINRLRFDVLKALLSDVNLGGITQGIDWTQPIMVEGDLGQYTPRAQFRLSVTYIYREDMS